MTRGILSNRVGPVHPNSYSGLSSGSSFKVWSIWDVVVKDSKEVQVEEAV